MRASKKFKTVDEYFSALPPKSKSQLKKIRDTVKKEAPGAEEVISYNIPAVRLNGLLVWYAAFKDHVSFFPRVSAIEKFDKELSGYELSKGTIKFPMDKPVPVELLKKIIKFRIQENLAKAKAKEKK